MNADRSHSTLYPPVLWKIGWRFLWMHRWQSTLMVLGITLGVAVMVAIDLANASASRAFELSTQAITGKTTHQISGGPQGLDESIYVNLRRQGLIDQAEPVIDAYVSSPQLGNRPLDLLGVDPFVDAPFHDYLTSTGLSVQEQLSSFLTQPGALMISTDLANRYGLNVGSKLSLIVAGRSQSAFISGLITPVDPLAKQALDGTLLADIATAQEITGELGKIDRIDLILPADSAALVKALQARLPAGVQINPAEAATSSIVQMTAAFRLNLSALSLLALVVGLFLIYNTMTFSVVRRRELFGAMRCLGITGREIFLLVMSEAFIVGIIGSVLGIGLGILMGQRTVGMVSQTINDLYFTTTVQAAGIPISSLVRGGVAGMLATLFTAALPAWEASTIPPQAALSRSGLEKKTRRNVLWMALGGFGLIVLGGTLFLVPLDTILFGFSGTLAVVVGFALLAAITMVFLLRGLAPFLVKIFGFLGRMAPRSLINALSRTSVAVAALMVAVAVTIGVSLMIDSFRYTVDLWLKQTLQGDVYITAPSFTANRSTVLIDPKVVQAVQKWPGLTRVDLQRSTNLESTQGMLQVSATNNYTFGLERSYLSLKDPPQAIWKAMQQGSVLVSEPLAQRLRLKTGGVITLNSPAGWKSFTVEGIYYDYASSEGTLYMTLDNYRRLWQDSGVTAIGIRLPPGTNPDKITQDLQNGLESQQQLIIESNLTLRNEVLKVFDRTFAITAALRILATVVAFIGVLSTLMLLQLEKQREIGILRAVGLTGRQLWQLVMLETGLMGLVAGVLAAPTGYVLSLILIYVINQRSFGWTLQQSTQPSAFLQGLAIAVIAALLAGIYPAGRLSRMEAADAIRYE
ncbi:MAG: FtsX-like permease family protein [Anaerolineaceae bacterium]|nr:FtsX-like permease family protein [Anaerolineaceae bacterium]